MLQWLTDDEVIFNQKRNGNLFAKIIDLRSGKHRCLPAPVYSLSSNRNIAYSVDFQSLGAYRKGYGYAGFDKIGSSDHRRNGISELDVNAGTERLVISHQKLIDLGFIGSTDKFWIDHILPSPDDKHIAFLLRKLSSDGAFTPSLYLVTHCGGNHGLALIQEWPHMHAGNQTQSSASGLAKAGFPG